MNRTHSKRRQVLEALEKPPSAGPMAAGEVMTFAPSCVPPESSALELVKLFHQKQFRHLLVTDASARLVGVVSDRDVIRYLGPNQRPDRSVLEGITAADVMSADLVTIGPSTPLDRATALLIEEGISCLPVLADGVLVGILTNTDLHVVLQVLLQTLRQSSPEQSTVTAGRNPQN